MPKLLVNRRRPNTTVLDAIHSVCEGCISADLAIAFVLRSGAQALLSVLGGCEVDPKRVTLIAGTDFNTTEPDALRRLSDAGLKLRLYSGSATFHPKLLCFGHARHLDVLVGSPNLSGSAMEHNVEALMHHRCRRGSDFARDVARFFRELRRESVTVTDKIIAQYAASWSPRPHGESPGRSRFRPRTTSHPGRHKRTRRRSSEVVVDLTKRRIFRRSPPRLVFKGKTYAFTGRFYHGSQADCIEATERRGARCPSARLTLDTDYLVVGGKGNPQFVWKTYGRKIERAVEWRKLTGRPIIIDEFRWSDSI